MDCKWLDYEQYIYNHFRTLYPSARIRKNIRLDGHISGSKRQLDVLVDFPETGIDVLIAVECKYFNKKVDVKIVDSFIGCLQDVKASKGILVANAGFTKAAFGRALRADRDVEVRIIEFDKLQLFQGFGGAVVFYDNCTLFIPCPNNWVVDCSLDDTFVAIYEYGLTFLRANALNEWIAIRNNNKSHSAYDIESLVNDIKIKGLSKYGPLEYKPVNDLGISKWHESYPTQTYMCEFMSNKYEYCYFVDVGDSIVTCLLYTNAGSINEPMEAFQKTVDDLRLFKITNKQSRCPIKI